MRHFGKNKLFFFLIKMVFYKKYGRKRYVRRNKALSTSRIFGKTGAKSQAKQIYALRKSVNRLNRRFKPEIKTLTTQATGFTFTNETASGTYKSFPGTAPTQGDGRTNRDGDKIFVKNLTWYFTFEYYDDYDPTQPSLDSAGAMIRIIIGQYKENRSGLTVPTPDDVISNYSGTGANYTHNIVSPLKPNITETYRILKDYKCKITESNNQKMFKLSVKPGTYRFDDANKFNNVWCLIVVSGLHWDSTVHRQYVKGTFSDKIAFVDY